MNIALWVVQALLAAAFLMAGGMKLTQPIDRQSKSLDWVRVVPPGFVRFIGAAEVLGAIGLILPMVTGILPWLTVAAGIGLAVVMVSAAVFHVSRGETVRVPTNLVLLLLAALVIVGRWVIAPA
jgi:putative oxidoreductase